MLAASCGETFSCTASQGYHQGQDKDHLHQKQEPLQLDLLWHLTVVLKLAKTLERDWVLPADDSDLSSALPGRQLCCRGCSSQYFTCCVSGSLARTELSPLLVRQVGFVLWEAALNPPASKKKLPWESDPCRILFRLEVACSGLVHKDWGEGDRKRFRWRLCQVCAQEGGLWLWGGTLPWPGSFQTGSTAYNCSGRGVITYCWLTSFSQWSTAWWWDHWNVR